MTKKCFAAIKTAQEMSARIKELTKTIDKNNTEAMYAALVEIKTINDKYVSNFGDVDPYWKKPETEKLSSEEKMDRIMETIF